MVTAPPWAVPLAATDPLTPTLIVCAVTVTAPPMEGGGVAVPAVGVGAEDVAEMVPSTTADPPLTTLTLPPVLFTAPPWATVTDVPDATTVVAALVVTTPCTVTDPAFVAPPTVTEVAPELASFSTVVSVMVRVVCGLLFVTGAATVTTPLDWTVTFVPPLSAVLTEAALIRLDPLAGSDVLLLDVVEVEPEVPLVTAVVEARVPVPAAEFTAMAFVESVLVVVVVPDDVTVVVVVVVVVVPPTVTSSGSSSQAPAAPETAWASARPSAYSRFFELVSMKPPLPPTPRAAALICPENTVSLSDQMTTLPPSPPARPSATRLAPRSMRTTLACDTSGLRPWVSPPTRIEPPAAPETSSLARPVRRIVSANMSIRPPEVSPPAFRAPLTDTAPDNPPSRMITPPSRRADEASTTPAMLMTLAAAAAADRAEMSTRPPAAAISPRFETMDPPSPASASRGSVTSKAISRSPPMLSLKADPPARTAVPSSALIAPSFPTTCPASTA